MKNIFKYILFASALFAPAIAHADGDENPPAVQRNYKVKDGVATGKSVSTQNSDGSYTITLETFATGSSKMTSENAPADIVLVLDLSQSMTANYKTEYSYTERTSQPYSYDSYGSNSYYYLHSDGEYYPVSRGYYETDGSGNNATRHYYLTFTANGTPYYLYGNGVTTDRPSEPNGRRVQRVWQNTGSTIWTGVLYSRSTTSQTRLEGLQDAVVAFVDEIWKNDNYTDNEHIDDAHKRDEPLGNRIAVVTYANNSSIYNSNAPLIEVSNADRSKNESMIQGILQQTSTTIGQNLGTYSNLGMANANTVLSGIDPDRKAKSTRTVVLFTDGIPGYTQNDWNEGNSGNQQNSDYTADNCIGQAHIAKTTHTAKVFTVGLFSSSITDPRVFNYMDYTSSNYPDAETQQNHGQPLAEEFCIYSKKAYEDLEGIFRDIASQSGGSSRSLPASSQVRDVVSSSFTLPDDFDFESVVAYAVDIKRNGESWYTVPAHSIPTTDDDVTAFANAEGVQLLTVVETVAELNNDETKVAALISTVTVTDDESGTSSECKMLTIQGFNYSKKDVVAGDGNWVGQRIVQEGDETSTFYAGKKLVIEFNIKPETGSTGGVGTNTNAKGSGVYVLGENGQYSSVNDYNPPHTDLPTVIKISKTGLNYGESATFQIVRYRPIGWNDDDPSDRSGFQYNALGKPMPNTATREDYSKVILTKKTNDNNPVVKTLMALDPNWVYEVFEDDWAWSYTYNGVQTMTTSDVEVNPFEFDNAKNSAATKHAEAVSINHFRSKNGEFGSFVETKKSTEVF